MCNFLLTTECAVISSWRGVVERSTARTRKEQHKSVKIITGPRPHPRLLCSKPRQASCAVMQSIHGGLDSGGNEALVCGAWVTMLLKPRFIESTDERQSDQCHACSS